MTWGSFLIPIPILILSSQIMETLLRIFSFRSATVHEEAMLAVGSFSYAVGRQFVKYLPQFSQYLKTGLTNYLEWQVCCLSSQTVLGSVKSILPDIILCPYVISTSCDSLVQAP